MYADQGAGKSTLTGTAPIGFKIHVVDFDGGMGLEPAKRLWLERGGRLGESGLSFTPPVTSFSGLHAALWNLPTDKDLYVLDTYTTAMKIFKAYVMQGKIEITDWRKVGGKISGLAIDYFDRWRTQVLQRGAWGLVLAQDKSKEVPMDSGNERLCPDLVGASGRDVSGMVDFLFHYEREKMGSGEWKRVLLTQDTPHVMAKDRSGALSRTEPADLEHIITKVEAHMAKVANQAKIADAL